MEQGHVQISEFMYLSSSLKFLVSYNKLSAFSIVPILCRFYATRLDNKNVCHL